MIINPIKRRQMKKEYEAENKRLEIRIIEQRACARLLDELSRRGELNFNNIDFNTVEV